MTTALIEPGRDVQTQITVTRRRRALLGFMTWDEAKAYVSSIPLAQALTETELRQMYERSQGAVAQLPNHGPEEPEIREMPPRLGKQLARLAGSELFIQVFTGVDWQFRMVEIDKIVAFQREVVLDSVHASRRPRGAVASRLLDYCLPLQWTSEFEVSQVNGNGISFSSWDPNLSLNVAIQPPVANFEVAFRPPYIQVAEFGGRYLLKNGYHLTFWLKKSGYTHVPCVLIRCNNYIQTGANHPNFFPQATVLGAGPPRVAHFVDENLTTTLRERRTKKAITLSWQELRVPI